MSEQRRFVMSLDGKVLAELKIDDLGVLLLPGEVVEFTVTEKAGVPYSLFRFENPEFIVETDDDDNEHVEKNTKPYYVTCPAVMPVSRRADVSNLVFGGTQELGVPAFRVLPPEPELSSVAKEKKLGKYKVSVSEAWTHEERLEVIAALTVKPEAEDLLPRIHAVAMSASDYLQSHRSWIMGEELEDVPLARS